MAIQLPTFAAAEGRDPLHGACRPESVVAGRCWRFTVLTEQLLRLEYSPDGIFEDRASQAVLNRDFPTPVFTTREKNGQIEISTSAFHLIYDMDNPFTAASLTIDVKNRYSNYGARWRFDERTFSDPPRHLNLLGTVRTLDKQDGAVPLDFGLMSQGGHAYLDDSESWLLEPDGTLSPRRPGCRDVYFFAYNHDYFACLRDFYRLSGRPPMLPRWALGNWWSRYWKYTDQSLRDLFSGFAEEDLPFSVAMLDMDWHVTDVPPSCGRGWTGYTWNHDYFPAPADTLQWLHEAGMHTALNLHPADGIQPCEEAYPTVAAELGITDGEAIAFDLTDPAFTSAYLAHLIHANEQLGVNFWWIDWQQGKTSRYPGLDQLWLLNHIHYLDSCRDGRRGLILSRYCGAGAHRYPAGFSGDTIVSWASLAFQPYFTVTAVNIGYPWWSHDIGGFKAGVRSGELYLRWVQFGVFSPFMRLHASNSPFTDKSPAAFRAPYGAAIREWLRFRYRLIPYLYTAVHRQNSDLHPMLYPLYYAYPNSKPAYAEKNQYFFGDQLLVCPITAPADPATGMGSVRAWVPPGRWTDFFTGHVYTGNRSLVLNRPVAQMPVLARPGAIVPLADREGNSTANPERMTVMVFPGGDGAYALYEDAGEGSDTAAAVTNFALTTADGGLRLTVTPTGDCSVLPAARRWQFCFRGFSPFTAVCDHPAEQHWDAETRTLTVTLPPIPAGESVCITAEQAAPDNHADRLSRVFQFLNLAELPVETKSRAYGLCTKEKDNGRLAASLATADLPQPVLNVLLELCFS